MTEEKEFDGLDELFSKTFENLPEYPDPNGWDKPSDRVWNNIKSNIGRKGWSLKQWAAVIAGTGLVALAAVVLYNQSADTRQQSAPADQPRVEQQSAAAPDVAPAARPVPADNSTTLPTAVAERPAGSVKPAGAQPSGPTTAARLPATEDKTPATRAETTGRPTPSGSQLLPGSKPVFPNTTERLRKEEAERRWKTPLQPLPSVLEKDKKPNY